MRILIILLAGSIALAGCVSAPPAKDATLREDSGLTIDPNLYEKSVFPERVKYTEIGEAGRNRIIRKITDFIYDPKLDSIFTPGFTMGIFMTRELSRERLSEFEHCPLVTKPVTFQAEKANRISAIYGSPASVHEKS